VACSRREAELLRKAGAEDVVDCSKDRCVCMWQRRLCRIISMCGVCVWGGASA
jgi:hypothetical protein